MVKRVDELTVTRLSTFDEFAACASEWDARLAEAGIENIFLTHPWLCEWWRAYGAGHELWTLVARDSKRVMGIAPLVLQLAPDGVRRLIFMGDGELTPNHLDVIVHPDARARTVCAFCTYLWKNCAEWDILKLDNFPAESSSHVLLAQTLRGYGLTVQSRVTAHCPFAVLPASFDELLQSIGSKTRKQLRYMHGVLARNFPSAQFGCVEAFDELPSVFDALMRLHQSLWIDRGKPGAFASAKFAAFHRAMASEGLARGMLRLYYLKFDCDFAAVQYCYRVGTRMVYYNAGFDTRWAKYSPGTLLLAHTLKQAIAEGVREYDFLQGEEAYKSHWAANVRDNWCVLSASPHWRGRLIWARQYWPRQFRRSVKQLLGGRFNQN